MVNQKDKNNGPGQALKCVKPVSRIPIPVNIGFREVCHIKPHDGMKQQGDINKDYFNDQQEGQIVN